MTYRNSNVSNYVSIVFEIEPMLVTIRKLIREIVTKDCDKNF